MIDALYQRVQERPQQLALCIDDNTLNYAELWQQAKMNAAILREKIPSEKLKENCLVALHLPKSNDFVVMQVACWMAGMAFMPLPPDWPLQRKKQVLVSASCVAIISNTRLPDNELPCWQPLSVSAAHSHTHCHQPPVATCKSDDLAYVVFTSGSSGQPKGVKITFSGLPHVITAQIACVQLQPGERTLWLHHIGFDASIADIWVALLAGASLYARSQLEPAEVPAFIQSHQVHYVDLPSPLLPYLEVAALSQYLHTVLVGGEVVEISVLKRWSQQLRVVIAYGPSEVSICSSMHVFQGHENVTGLIGQPLSHLQYHVLGADSDNDAACNDVIGNNSIGKDSTGELGELLIVGPGVATGYMSDSPSQHRFTTYDGMLAYRTGDVVRRLDDNFQFIGRIDRQFKYRGKLICPEEVEGVVRSCDWVKEAHVFLFNGRLIAAIVAEQSSESIAEILQQKLPEWMCPEHYLVLPSLPRNRHQKVDHHALCALAKERFFVASDDPVLFHVQSTLADASINYDSCLADFSPDSLQWLQLLVRLQRLGFELDFTQLSAPRSFASILSEASPAPNISASSEELLPELKRFSNVKPAVQALSHDAILLTGATGKLGSQLLVMMAQSRRRIYCIVRGGEAHLRQTFSKRNIYFVWDNIIAIDGDIAKPRCGLADACWQELATQVRDIFHCAADTSLLKTCQQMQAVNVCGTYHVMSLLSLGQKKYFHYASTLSLVVDSDWQGKTVDEHNPLASGIFFGGYTQSKWLAEQLVQRMGEGNIFRFGLLVSELDLAVPEPDHVNSASRDWVELQLSQNLDMSLLPGDAAMDFTPLGYAAECMWKISQHQRSGVYHILNPQSVSAEAIAEAITEVIDEQMKNLATAKKQKPVLWQESHTSPLRLFKMRGTDIRSDKTRALLKKLDLNFPKVDNTYLAHYIKTLWQIKN